jgi:hypothetical protein
MPFTTTRCPEWRTLYNAILPLVQAGQKEFDYETLGQLAGIDIRSDSGRGQFYRFRREMLREWHMWFENVAGYGYAIIPAAEKPKAAYKRVHHARRKVHLAKQINNSTDIAALTPEQRLIQAATAAVLHDLSKTFHAVARKFHLAGIRAERTLPIDIEKLLASVSKPIKPMSEDKPREQAERTESVA